eukprot:COSAG02_NODE_195_length_29750_cov_79.793329_18_plen_143_part_00
MIGICLMVFTVNFGLASLDIAYNQLLLGPLQYNTASALFITLAGYPVAIVSNGIAALVIPRSAFVFSCGLVHRTAAHYSPVLILSLASSHHPSGTGHGESGSSQWDLCVAVSLSMVFGAYTLLNTVLIRFGLLNLVRSLEEV